MKIQRRNDLSLRLLEVFGTLMLHQTTVETATELGISQPAVSLAIKQLEKQLGFPLFERFKKRLHPTEEARSLFREIEPVFGLLRSVESHVRDLRDGTEGKLRLLATPPLGNVVVPTALKGFLAGRPNVSVRYDVGRMDDVIESIEYGAAELGLVLALERHPAVHARVLGRYRMVALMPADHALAARTTVTPSDAAEHGVIGLDDVSRLGLLLQVAFERDGVAYEPRVTVRHCHSAATLASAGIGVAVVDPFTAAFVASLELVSRPFEPAIAVPACVLTRSDLPLSRVAGGFVEAVEAVLARIGIASCSDTGAPLLETDARAAR